MKDTIEIGLLAAILVLLVRRDAALPKRRSGGILLDSCALIDGRVVGLVQSGFMSEDIIIPGFILRELQLLADGLDGYKRERARFGLDVAAQLQTEAKERVHVDTTDFPEISTIDDKLVALARKRHASLCTTDLNLNKVATIEGVRVLNMHELAQNMRPALLPGEVIEVKILQKGSGHGQGVGYLEDGTMLVVDGAAKFIGKTIRTKVVRMHQTVAGKMAFATVVKK